MSTHTEIVFSQVYGGKPCLALEKLTFHLKNIPSAAPVPVKLCITVNEHCFLKTIPSEPTEHDFWIGIHRHLLSAGTHPIHCEVQELGRTVWQWDGEFEVEPLNALGQAVRDSLIRRSTPVIIEGPLDTSFYDFSDPSLVPWFDTPGAHDHIRRRQAQEGLTDARAQLLQDLVGQGFFVRPGLIAPDLIDWVRADLEAAAAEGCQNYQPGSGQQIHHLHLRSEAMAHLWRHPDILDSIGMVFEAEARPCQTLSFMFGSQLLAHQDTIHLTPFPAGYMMGVWVALEDIRPGSGELFYCPGSHREPRVYAHHCGWPGLFGSNKGQPGQPGQTGQSDFLRLATTAQKAFNRYADLYPTVPYLPKKGDVLFWHESLLHGGFPRQDFSISRKSVAMHYFAHGSIPFADSWGAPCYMDPITPP